MQGFITGGSQWFVGSRPLSKALGCMKQQHKREVLFKAFEI